MSSLKAEVLLRSSAANRASVSSAAPWAEGIGIGLPEILSGCRRTPGFLSSAIWKVSGVWTVTPLCLVVVGIGVSEVPRQHHQIVANNSHIPGRLAG